MKSVLIVLLLVICVAFSKEKTAERIIGGTRANPGQFPFQVAIYNLQASTICGGSILSASYVLTAAHCVREILSNGNKDTDPAKLSVVSTNDISDKGANDQSRTGSVLYIHNSYSFGVSFFNRIDIAIIKVNAPFNFGSGTIAGTINLSEDPADEAAGQIARVSGFGTTVSNQQGNSVLATTLLYVDVPIVDKATCDARAAANGLGSAPNLTLCAGEAGKDSCAGDSGGPLFIQKNGAPLQIGVVSTGTTTTNPLCGAANEYGIYTSVAKNKDWIATVLSLTGNQTAPGVTVSTASPSVTGSVFEGTWSINSGSCDPNSCDCCFTGSVTITRPLELQFFITFSDVKGTKCSSSFLDGIVGIKRLLFMQQNLPVAGFYYSGQIYVVAIDGKNMTITQGTAPCSNPDVSQCSTSSGNCNVYSLNCTGGRCNNANKYQLNFMLFSMLIAFIFTIFYRAF